jgi:DNA-binding transcriptional regulator YiaG
VDHGKPMNCKEIRELMTLKGWSQAELARHLDLSEAAVCRWFRDAQKPTGPARILMRQWLAEAKQPAAAGAS